ncbi:MAG: WbqC family protein [Endomicrobiales bacterium]|nr:WbqC family protein [Endomicrobiales bacterium]
MILSVHQPQYMPWLGYFHKMAKCDLFVYLDDVQYKKREFQNRNKIKTPNGAHWLTVPVITKDSYLQQIREVRTNPDENWENEHLQSLRHNYGRTPFFKDHEGFFAGLFSKDWEKLMDVSLEITGYFSSFLKIGTRCGFASEFGVSSTSSQRIVDICIKAGADTYLSGAGGREYMEMELFEKNNIKVVFQEFSHPRYPQLFGEFIPYLSIVDLVFNCGPESAKNILGNA